MSEPPASISGVTAVLLAAGRSQRLGGDRPKQLLDFHGEPMVRRVARQALAARLDRLIAVVGYRADDVRTALEALPLEVVENPHWASGRASSIQAGVAAATADGGEPAALLFTPADQPLLAASDIDRIVAAWSNRDPAIVQPRFAGRPGAPVLLSRGLFAELAALQGEAGGRSLIARRPELVQPVEMAREAPLLDVDDESRYRELLALAAREP